MKISITYYEKRMKKNILFIIISTYALLVNSLTLVLLKILK